MEKRPTKKQRELLNYISEFIANNGYGPSYREMMRALDYKSVSTVATHVNGLIARGFLMKKDNSARSLDVCGEGSLSQATPQSEASAKAAIQRKIAELTKDQSSAEDVAVLQKALSILYPAE